MTSTHNSHLFGRVSLGHGVIAVFRILAYHIVVVVIAFSSLAQQTDEVKKSEIPNTESNDRSTDEQADQEPEAKDANLTLEDILKSKPVSSDYSSTENCITRRNIKNYDVLNERLIVFEMRKGERFLLLLQQNCFGIHPRSTIRIDSHGSLKVCRGDSVRAQTVDFSRQQWGPACLIPGFEPVTEHQLTLLKEGIKSGRVN